MNPGRRRDLLLLLLLATAPAVAHAPAWLSGRLLAPGDGRALHLPMRVEAWRALARGEIPTWDPSAFSGTPLLAAYRPGALHPMMLALAPLPPPVAFQLLVLVSLGLAAVLAWACARRLGAGPTGALLCGLGYALGPYLVSHLGDTATVVAAPAIPLLLLAAESLLARPRVAAIALVASTLAVLLLAGSKEAVGAAFVLLAARAVFWRAGSPGATPAPGAARSLLAAVGTGALLAAPQLLPTVRALLHAAHGEAGAAAVPAGPLDGIAGLLVRYVSHTPAPLFALTAVALLASRPALRPAALVCLLGGGALALRARPAAAGALPLAFDFALALLAALALSAQLEEPRSRRAGRLRALTAATALCAAALLSAATTVTGPLDPELQAPVGLLALSLILYVLLGESADPVVARVFVLPLVASFLMQPWGRDAWAGTPTWRSLVQGTATREAIDRVMGPRRTETTLALATSWPEAHADDLAWANLATFAGRRNANGYDPLVPSSRGEALAGMRADGTVPREMFRGDPGRLELLGVRWVEVPTSALVVAPDENGLGEALDTSIEPARPRRFALPFVTATEVRIASYLAGAADVEQGEIVAECVARLATGREIWLPIRAGVDTAEWAIERPDVRAIVKHHKAPVLTSFTTTEGFVGHEYLARLRLPGRFTVLSLRVRALAGAPPLWLLRAGLHDHETGLDHGVSLVSGYLSEEVRLALAASTPRVTLVEVRQGIGRARVVGSLRVVPDRHAALDLLGSPTRLGVDSMSEAIAEAADVAGFALPEGSRPSSAVVARAVGGHLVVQARGPGLLVIGEGYDEGWTARVDDTPARIVRVNADRMGVAIGEGTHRVVLDHGAPGFVPGLALAALGATLLLAALAVERRRRRG